MEQYNPVTVASVFPSDAWELPALCGPNGGNCVEVNLGAKGIIGLRDSKLPTGPVLVFDDEEWRSFVRAARGGQYDR